MNSVAMRASGQPTPAPNWRMMAPDRRLSAHVLCYYLELPSSAESPAPEQRRGAEELLIPDGHSEVVFTIGNAFERWAVGRPEQREVMSRSYVIGGRSHSVVTRDLGPVAVAGVKLDPRALRWWIGTPLAEFRDSTLGLQELEHAGLLELERAVRHAALQEPRPFEAVAQAFDRALLRAFGEMPSSRRPVDALLTDIRAQRGAVSILDWVERHGLDARQVERQFMTSIGMTPKRYARVIRFKHSYHQLLSGASAPRGAHLDGYYDQSHFNKEFRAFVGGPPSALLAAALRHGTRLSDQLLAGELAGRGAPRR